MVQPQRGGVYRTNSGNNTWDTFDADRTIFSLVATVLRLTNQGVVGWDRYETGEFSGQFAEEWEQPDETTFVFKVRPGLVWHDKPPVNGRPAHAEDIAYHIERNKAGLLLDGTEAEDFHRKVLFQNIESAEVVDESTIRVRTIRPWPFLLNLLAGPWAKVQAPEAVEAFEADYERPDGEFIIGTGSFELAEFDIEGDLTYRRHDQAVRQPWLDGERYLPGLAGDAAARQVAFEQKRIDRFISIDQAILEDMRNRLEGRIYERSYFPAATIGGWYFGGAPPWNDPRLIGAIFRALDRMASLDEFFEGHGALSGVGPPAWTPFALPDEELRELPGYLEDRSEDEVAAKEMWAAGGGPTLGEITIDVMDLFELANPGAAQFFADQLQAVLGNSFVGRIEPPAVVNSKRVEGKYGSGSNSVYVGFSVRPEDPDLSLFYAQWFKEGSSNQEQLGVELPGLQPIIQRLETEFDLQARIGLCHEAERELLANWGGGFLPLFQPRITSLFWNYLNFGETTNFVTTQNDWRDLWLDQTDPTWQGRPA